MDHWWDAIFTLVIGCMLYPGYNPSEVVRITFEAIHGVESKAGMTLK